MLQKRLDLNNWTLLWIIIIYCGVGCTTNPFNPVTEESLELRGIFPNADYDKAIAYHFEDLNGRLIVSEKGKLNPTIKKQKELTEKETRDFLQVINKSETYGGNCANCYFPRFGVVFYKQKEIVAHISICLQCGHQKASLEVGAQANLENGNCYSAVGLDKLTRLCKKLGFGQCD